MSKSLPIFVNSQISFIIKNISHDNNLKGLLIYYGKNYIYIYIFKKSGWMETFIFFFLLFTNNGKTWVIGKHSNIQYINLIKLGENQ